jgi:formylglycine-generating enzyme required for sulfatase activity
MAGNLWEMTQDCYIPNMDKLPEDGTSPSPKACSQHAIGSMVIKGGSWETDAMRIRPSKRSIPSRAFNFETIGFRCAKSRSQEADKSAEKP